MHNYIAVVHKDSASEYGASFPDFPGCITAGKTIDEVKDLSLEALSGHIKVMKEFGEKIPNPSKLDDVISDQGNRDAVAFLVISIPNLKSKTVRVNITLPEDMLHQIDITAKKKSQNAI